MRRRRNRRKNGVSSGATIGIVAAAVLSLGAVGYFLWFRHSESAQTKSTDQLTKTICPRGQITASAGGATVCIPAPRLS